MRLSVFPVTGCTAHSPQNDCTNTHKHKHTRTRTRTHARATWPTVPHPDVGARCLQLLLEAAIAVPQPLAEAPVLRLVLHLVNVHLLPQLEAQPLIRLLIPAHTHTHTCTHKHTNTHTHTCTHKHTNTHTCTHRKRYDIAQNLLRIQPPSCHLLHPLPLLLPSLVQC